MFAGGVSGIVSVPAEMWEQRERIFWMAQFGLLVPREELEAATQPTTHPFPEERGRETEEAPEEAFAQSPPPGYTTVKFSPLEDESA